MRKVAIICSSYYDLNGEFYKIGGVETYIRNLSRLFKKNNFDIEIYQYANKYFEIDTEFGKVMGIETKNIKKIIHYVEKNVPKDTIVIFATDYLIRKNSFKYCIAIQHGVAWDICQHKKKDFIFMFIDTLRKALSSLRKIYSYNFCENIVCVDYNFINWYRTQTSFLNIRFFPIMNFTELPKKVEKEENNIKIIFARRFVDYRGTKLFANVIPAILNKYNNVQFTFAGDGPDKEWIKNKFKNEKRVKIISYDADESLKIHKDYHIAVIPTIGSEGTSLSLLEAMASSCAVIASNVGGMTNVILDEYNGLLINPTENDLKSALIKLINNKNIREEISKNAYATVSKSFSHEKWEKKWIDVVKKVGISEYDK